MRFGVELADGFVELALDPSFVHLAGLVRLEESDLGGEGEAAHAGLLIDQGGTQLLGLDLRRADLVEEVLAGLEYAVEADPHEDGPDDCAEQCGGERDVGDGAE